MQFQADVLGRVVRRPKMAETTAIGAAILAGIASELWRSPNEVAHLSTTERVFRPTMTRRERVTLLSGWKSAIERVLTRHRA